MTTSNPLSTDAVAQGASSDGAVIVGIADVSGNDNASWWDKTSGVGTPLSFLSGGSSSYAYSIDSSGAVISGSSDNGSSQWAVTWDKTSGLPTKLPYGSGSDLTNAEALGISADASTAVGYDIGSGVDDSVWWDLAATPGTPLAIAGWGLAGASGSARLAITTPLRGRTLAGASGNAALSWSTFALNLTGITLAGAKGSAGFVPPETRLGGQTRAGASGKSALIDTTFLPIFPTLPVGFPVTVKPIMANVVGQIPVGRDMRAPEQTLPIWEIDLNFEELRDQTQNSVPYSNLAGFTDFTQLVQLFLASVGQYGQFLLDAPWDDSRVDQIIGTGDGTTKTFFMVRTWGYGQLAFTEPVGAVNSVLNVKINGVVLSPAFWTIVDRNILTFATAPASNAVITSTFSYYYRCQWAEDQQQYEEFLKDRWTAKIKMRSVFPQLPGYLAALPTLLSPGPFPPSLIVGPFTLWSLTAAFATSSDGSIIVGIADGAAPGWWNKYAPYSPTLLLSLPGGSTPAGGVAYGVSADGNTIVGWTTDGSNQFAVSWDRTSGIPTKLSSTLSDPVATGIGVRLICGYEGPLGTTSSHAVTWTMAGAKTTLPLGAYDGSAAYGISADDNTVVGEVTNIVWEYPAAWINGTLIVLPTLVAPVGTISNQLATACSANGKIIVGQVCTDNTIGRYQGCWWNSNGGPPTVLFTPLGSNSTASGITADGNTICGHVDTGSTVPDYAVTWNRATGEMTILYPMYNFSPPFAALHTGANGISADGSIIAGQAQYTVSSDYYAVWWTN